MCCRRFLCIVSKMVTVVGVEGVDQIVLAYACRPDKGTCRHAYAHYRACAFHVAPDVTGDEVARRHPDVDVACTRRCAMCNDALWRPGNDTRLSDCVDVCRACADEWEALTLADTHVEVCTECDASNDLAWREPASTERFRAAMCRECLLSARPEPHRSALVELFVRHDADAARSFSS